MPVLKKTTFQLKCQLEENKICDNCCDCFICDLDPNKICDNCARCLNLSDYSGILIDDILVIEEFKERKKTTKKK